MDYSILSTYVREDNDYLDEWVTYHLSIGFEHIVMYDHKSITPVQNIWGSNVTVIRVERDSLFIPTYLNYETLKSHPSYWMAMLDVDEFLVLKRHKDVREILPEYEEFGAVAIPWVMFGSSKHLIKPAGRVIDNYLWRSPVRTEQWIKSIINTQYCTNIVDPHRGEYSRPAVGETKRPLLSPATTISDNKIFQLNHYFTRSFEEWMKKVERGTGNPNTPPRPISWFDDVNNAATIYDDFLLDFGKK
jgi:hypothetical protein